MPSTLNFYVDTELFTLLLWCLCDPQWLSNCKAAFPRSPGGTAITRQPAEHEEKVTLQIFKNEWNSDASLSMKINVKYWFGIFCGLVMHSASVQTHKRLFNLKQWMNDWPSTDLSYCTLCISITVFYCSSVSVASNFLTLCKCQDSDNPELPHVTLIISFQCALWLF